MGSKLVCTVLGMVCLVIGMAEKRMNCKAIYQCFCSLMPPQGWIGLHPSIRGVRIGKEGTYIFSIGVPPCSLICRRMEEAPLQCSANQTTRWNTAGKVVGFFLFNTFYLVEGCLVIVVICQTVF